MKYTQAYASFSVKDISAAKAFYIDTLGLQVEDGQMGIRLKAGAGVFVYEKPDHVPATYTVLNFEVDDIDAAVDELMSKGVKFEQYPDMTDEKGVARGKAAGRGPDIAWFTDPAGNIFSVMTID